MQLSATWYKDGDGDTYYITMQSCNSPGTGWSKTSQSKTGDCNDNSASVYPGATEICGNGIDEDCNGSDLVCGGGNPCNVANTITASMPAMLAQNAGANQPNTYYWGLSYTMHLTAKPTGGVGPYTYAWTSKSGYTITNANKKTAGLYYPTGAGWVKVAITDVGTSCTRTDSIYINFVDFTCNPPGMLWYYQMCRNGQTTVCVWRTARMMDSLATGNYTLGACTPKSDQVFAGTTMNMEVYPNPNNGEFNIVVRNVTLESTLEIFDFSAKRINVEELTPDNGSIHWSYDMRNLPPGVYFIQLRNADGLLTDKVVIRH